MTTRAAYAFIREGTSDDGLLPHLSDLLVRAGLDEVVGSPRPYKGSIERCLRLLCNEEAQVDIVFVHRDADSASSATRRSEIDTATREMAQFDLIVVPVVPIQELEAWLLLDETAIRTVAGRPSGRGSLGIPKASRIESTASPKEILKAALLAASETSGRRRKEEKKRFADRRRTLLARLDLDGPIRNLSAWRELERDVQDAVRRLSEK